MQILALIKTNPATPGKLHFHLVTDSIGCFAHMRMVLFLNRATDMYQQVVFFSTVVYDSSFGIQHDHC